MLAEDVVLKTESLQSILQYDLSIPDYQRIYCWDEDNVIKLLDDIVDCGERTFHLGSIILHKSQQKFEIVDGQQRLVTLCLLFSELQAEEELKLMGQRFESQEAQRYIAYNKWVIRNYVAKTAHIKGVAKQLFSNLLFSVLIINEGTLDLAYTFFSNQNSRGKPLSDYDLLKAHHLRYVFVQEQAMHLAERWNRLVSRSGKEEEHELDTVVGLHLFRLRKWMRKRQWNDNEKLKVKTEFEAARFIPDIPPFGEQFHFYESIQGGAHFFGYIDYFIEKFASFRQTTEFKALRDLEGESHANYRNIIESFLFAYYLKFGTIYLAEAFLGITRMISEVRFQSRRFYLNTVLRFAADSELILMIQQATSPTFFLADLLHQVKKLPVRNDLDGIRLRYSNKIYLIAKKVVNSTTVHLNFGYANE